MNKLIRISCVLAVLLFSTARTMAQSIVFNCTKTTWNAIGHSDGEAIGTVELTGDGMFDHFEAEIWCQDDPDQYITFANCNTNGGQLVCYAWEGGHYDLNADYHYTLIIKAFDTPYYGLPPVATKTINFIGTGIPGTPYCNITLTNIGLSTNSAIENGYTHTFQPFNVTFSEPVSRVEAWCEIARTGSVDIETTKNSSDGRTWSINGAMVPFGTENGIANLVVTAWNSRGIQMRGVYAHGYPINLVATPTGIDSAISNVDDAQFRAYNLTGQRVNGNGQKGICIINGKKTLKK